MLIIEFYLFSLFIINRCFYCNECLLNLKWFYSIIKTTTSSSFQILQFFSFCNELNLFWTVWLTDCRQASEKKAISDLLFRADRTWLIETTKSWRARSTACLHESLIIWTHQPMTAAHFMFSPISFSSHRPPWNYVTVPEMNLTSSNRITFRFTHFIRFLRAHFFFCETKSQSIFLSPFSCLCYF